MSGYSDQVIVDGAAAYWRLDETSGTIAASKVGTYNGTISAGVTLNQVGALADGNRAMLFNGSTGSISVASAPALQINGDLTLEFWVKLSSLATRCTPLTKSFANEFEVTIETNGNVNFYSGGATGNVSTSTFPVTTGTWCHVVVTRAATAKAVTIYVNGVQKGAGTYTQTISTGTSPVSIGTNIPNTQPVTGLIDEVALYPVVLTATQVGKHYQLSTFPTLSTTIVLYPGESVPSNIKLRNPLAAIGLVTGTEVHVSSQASLRTGAALRDNAVISISSKTNLNVPSSFSASAALNVSATASFTSRAVFRASAQLSVSTTAQRITLPAKMSASSSLTVASSGKLRAGASLRAAPTIPLSSSAFLTRVAQVFASSSGIIVGTAGLLSPFLRGLVTVTINGVVNPNVRYGSINVEDVLNESPNTCRFTIDGGPRPQEGNDVQISLGNAAQNNVLFAGTITRVTQRFTGKLGNVTWDVNCLDYTFLFNRRKVFYKAKEESASFVAMMLLTLFANGFNGGGVDANLPPVTVDWDGVDPASAFTDLANLIGGYFYITYGKVVFLTTQQDPVAPDAITGANLTTLNDPAFNYTIDLTQLRTQVLVEGKSSNIVGISGTKLFPGFFTSIPLSDSAQFSTGQVITDEYQVINYTRADSGGFFTEAQPSSLAGPGFTPNPVISTTQAGRLSGFYRWTVSFGNDTGETVLGPATIQINTADFPTPDSNFGVGPTGVAGPLNGFYKWVVTFTNSLGETLGSQPISRNCVGLVPSNLLAVINRIVGISRLSPGFYRWKVTYVTPFGETVGSGEISANMADIPPPFGWGIQSGVQGLLEPGQFYGYKCTFESQDGETLPSQQVDFQVPPLSGVGITLNQSFPFGGLIDGPYSYGGSFITNLGESRITSSFVVNVGLITLGSPFAMSWTGQQDPGLGRIEPGRTYLYAFSFYNNKFGETPLSPPFSFNVGGSVPIRAAFNIPILNAPQNARCDGIRIYRAVVASGSTAGTPYMLNADFNNSGGSLPLSYIDALSQGECGNPYPINPMRAGVGTNLTMFPVNEPGVVARRLYRTRAGANEFMLVAQVDNNFQTTIIDVAFDQDISVRDSPANKTGRSTRIVNLLPGPPGTLRRHVYRTKVGASGQLYRVATINDNASTQIDDNVADGALTIPAPSVSTIGSSFLGQYKTTINLATGPPGLKSRRIYRTKHDGSTFYQVGDVEDPTATEFLDDTPDNQLDSHLTVPITNTAGGEEVQLTNIPVGPTGTLARIIYRTLPNGADYFQCVRLADNVTRTAIDRIPDTSLGRGVPLVSTAGAQAVTLNNIPTGPTGIDRRHIYRTKNTGGPPYFFVATIGNNLDTSFTDTKADTELGKAFGETGTPQIGALPGATVLQVKDNTGFHVPGWLRASGQYVEYTGTSGTTAFTGIKPIVTGTLVSLSGDTMTVNCPTGHGFIVGASIIVSDLKQSEFNGVQEVSAVLSTTQFQYVLKPPHPTTFDPAPGALDGTFALPGSITAAIPSGAEVEQLPGIAGLITGVPSPLPIGSGIGLWVVRTSTAGVAAIIAKEGGDGIHQFFVRDNTIDSVTAANKRGDAELTTFQFGKITMTYPSRDMKNKSGRTVHIALPAPHNITTDLLIQNVSIDQVGVNTLTLPRFLVTATNVKFSIQDLVRHVMLDLH